MTRACAPSSLSFSLSWPWPGSSSMPPNRSARWPTRTTTRRSSPGSSAPTCSLARTRSTSTSRAAAPQSSSPCTRPTAGIDPALEHAKALSADSPVELGTLEAQVAAEDSWDAAAKIAVDAKQAGDSPRGLAKSAYRQSLVDSFGGGQPRVPAPSGRGARRGAQGCGARPGQDDPAGQHPARRDRVRAQLPPAPVRRGDACGEGRGRRGRARAIRRARPASARPCRSPRTRRRATRS